jgi:uncharacterized lipoprotein
MRLFLFSCLMLSLTLAGCSDQKQKAPDSANFKAQSTENAKPVQPMTVPNK